jgi:signal transduction histidine kinase
MLELTIEAMAPMLVSITIVVVVLALYLGSRIFFRAPSKGYSARTNKKLFYRRLVAARGLAYILLIVLVAALYSVILSIFSVLVAGSHTDYAVIGAGAAFAIITGIIFQYVRARFAKAAHRIFFSDSYESEAVLNQVIGVMTSTHELSTLLKKAAEIFERALKCSFCSFTIIDKHGDARFFNTQREMTNEIQGMVASVEALLKPHMVLGVEELSANNPLKQSLEDLKIELIIPLYVNQRLVGYSQFGRKTNGGPYTATDIKMLALAADSLALAAQNALQFEEIERLTLSLQERVNEATRKLRHSNEKLKSLDETKDDFISMASHQLRTPLTSVKGYLSMVLEGDAGKITQTQREMLGQAFFSSQRMVYIIADLLNVSRIKNGKFVIERVRTNLAGIVEEELEQLEESAAIRTLTLQYDKPEDFPDLYLDETKTRQIIMNFIDNAIYYTPEGGRIIIRLIDRPLTVELQVEDNGIGVPRSEQHHLFTKFYRAANARKARPDGTGLGLFMAKKVIIAQGGSLIFNSQEGKGSTFGFVFSKSRLSLPPEDQIVTDGSGPKQAVPVPERARTVKARTPS